MGLATSRTAIQAVPSFGKATGQWKGRPIPARADNDDAPVDCNGKFNVASLFSGNDEEREVTKGVLVIPPPIGDRTRHVEQKRDSGNKKGATTRRASLQKLTCGL